MTDKRNLIVQIGEHGQSIWCDFVERKMIQNGAFAKMILEDGLTGITSNPTIFEKAITKGTEYDADLARLGREGVSAEEICWSLIIQDIRDVADVFRPVYDKTQAKDGYVSIEVSPFLANETRGTVKQAKELWKKVDRPNVMIKIPATKEGLPAITEVLAEGINVNVTLIFSIQRHREVMEAHLRGLEALAAKGAPLDRVASVASFFVSRVDTEIDARLQKRIAQAQGTEKKTLTALSGKAAIANSKIAYAEFEHVYSSDRFKKLAAHGAQVQRPLWASTSTKNPDYPDVLYVEELIGPLTVNTVPPATLDAFRDHGRPANTLKKDVKGAHEVLKQLKSAGVDLDKVTHELELAGVKSFSDSFRSLIDSIKAKEIKIGVKTK